MPFSVVHLALFGVLFHVDEFVALLAKHPAAVVALRLLVVGHAALLAKDSRSLDQPLDFHVSELLCVEDEL